MRLMAAMVSSRSSAPRLCSRLSSRRRRRPHLDDESKPWVGEVLCQLRRGGARRSAYLRAVSDVDVGRLQASLNRFTNRWLENVAPLIVDGEKGFLTNRRIMTAKWYLGYLGERDGIVTSRFARRMRHPRDPRWSSVRQVLRGIRRRRRQRRRAIEDLDPRPGVSRFDGRPVATWLRRYLVGAREHGLARPAHFGLALARAQRAAVLGDLRPADLSGPLRRARLEPFEEAAAARAVDVSDYIRFGELMRRAPFRPRIFNALGPTDPAHFSSTGR
jgi:hypothetical protein